MSKNLRVKEGLIIDVLTLFHHLNAEFKLEEREGKKWIIPPPQVPTIKVELSLSEWISLQAHFPFLSDCQSHSYHQTLKHKFQEVERCYSQADFFEAKNSVKVHLKQLFQAGYGGLNPRILRWLEMIQKAVLEKKLLTVHCENSSDSQKVFPHQVAYLVGCLNLIAEDLWDKCLTNFKLDAIESMEIMDESYRPVHLEHEVQDFIQSLRDFNENSLRVVLKISRPEAIPKNMPFQNFINPYIVTNGGGDIIWAATLEPNEQIFAWVHKHRDAIQILDPDDFKTAFSKYCKLLSTQKAS